MKAPAWRREPRGLGRVGARGDPAHTRAIERLAAVTQAGSSLLLAADGIGMARHAAALGLLAGEVAGNGAADWREGTESAAPPAPGAVVIGGESPQAAAAAIERGEIRAMREAGADPVNVLVGPRGSRA